MRRLTFLFILLAIPALAGENLVPKLVQHWKTSKAYTLAIAKQMPEDGYGFKPNPDQMSFKEQMMHIAQMNEYFLGRITGRKPAAAKPLKLDKESVIQYLNASFDDVIQSVGRMTAKQADKNIEGLLKTLADPKKAIQNKTLDVTRRMAQLMPKLNVVEDHRLDAVCQRLLEVLDGVTHNVLSTDLARRDKVAADLRLLRSTIGGSLAMSSSIADEPVDEAEELSRAAA